MQSQQTLQRKKPSTSYRIEPNRDGEIWLAVPKGGRTLGAPMADFLSAAGLAISDQISRRDDYILVDRSNRTPIGVRAIEMKPQMGLALLSQNKLDSVIVGRDVVKEFNAAVNRQTGVQEVSEILDFDSAKCVLSLAVQEGDPANCANDMNGRVVVTKYPELVKRWARQNNISFARVVNGINMDGDVTGGIEGYRMFDPSVTVIADIIESGESLVRYGWKPLGMKDGDWAKVKTDIMNDTPKPQRFRYIDYNPKKLDAIAGTIVTSRAILTRNNAPMTDEKQDILADLVARFAKASRKLGNNPIPKREFAQSIWTPRRPTY